MKISASIYSNTEKDLTSLIKELDAHRVDFFHIDCNDNINQKWILINCTYQN